ncbi:hypothetical protein Hanom_Chr16g01434561 [Helianthus anomalus]
MKRSFQEAVNQAIKSSTSLLNQPNYPNNVVGHDPNIKRSKTFSGEFHRTLGMHKKNPKKQETQINQPREEGEIGE